MTAYSLERYSPKKETQGQPVPALSLLNVLGFLDNCLCQHSTSRPVENRDARQTEPFWVYQGQPVMVRDIYGIPIGLSWLSRKGTIAPGSANPGTAHRECVNLLCQGFGYDHPLPSLGLPHLSESIVLFRILRRRPRDNHISCQSYQGLWCSGGWPLLRLRWLLFLQSAGPPSYWQRRILCPWKLLLNHRHCGCLPQGGIGIVKHPLAPEAARWVERGCFSCIWRWVWAGSIQTRSRDTHHLRGYSITHLIRCHMIRRWPERRTW